MADTPYEEPTVSEDGTDAREITEVMKPPRRNVRRIFVKLDMEGASGIVNHAQTRPGSADYEAGRRLLMSDLKAVLEGVFAAGCDEAVVYDAHAEGRNIDLHALDGKTLVISGRPQLENGFFCGLHDGFAALFLVGYHARAGAHQALLPHTYDHDIAALRLNNSELGEVGMEAALAGEFGVPLAFVSGDSATVLEAHELLGEDVETVEVKRAVSETSGICLPAARSAGLLREAAVRALRRARDIPPIVFQSPATLEIVFEQPDSAAQIAGRPGMQRCGECTIRCEGPTVLAAYQLFLDARRGNGALHLPSSNSDSTSE